ncbi:MAG: AraC family ligand binding domain-containing protein, partial [Clostridium sp.]
MELYSGVTLHQELVVEELVTVHYFEYTSSYVFPGETHDFWEFLYVDKGEIVVTAGSAQLSLKKGELIFHKPMEFHNLRSNGVVAPNLVVVTFRSHSPAMAFFEHKLLRAGNCERDLIAQIVREAKAAYCSPLEDPELCCLTRRETIPFGAEQML